jgi:tetratricopeptide (TPR) repeat protein
LAEVTIAEAFTEALAHHQAGRINKAEPLYRAILGTDPNHADSLHLLGVIAIQVRRFDVAVQLINEALARHKSAAYYSNLSTALLNIGRVDDAIEACRQALLIDPTHADAELNRGTALMAQGKIEEASACFRQAIALRPLFPLAHINLGNALQRQGWFAIAADHYRAALQMNPNLAEAHAYLGTALQEQGKATEAEFHEREAIRINPDFAQAHGNLSLILQQRGEIEGSIAFAREAIRLSPDLAEAHLTLGLSLLLDGQLAEGWREYEWRWRVNRAPFTNRGFTQPQWTGQALGKRVLLVHGEQGLGDAIQFVRYVPLVASGAKVVLEVAPILVPLFKQMPVEVIGVGEKLPRFDMHCPIISLAAAFKTTSQTIPHKIPYLKPDPDKVAVWRERIAGLPGKRVGLAWAGAKNHPRDRYRSIALDRLIWLSGLPEISFVSLQKGEAAEQIKSPPPGLKIYDWTDELHDLSDTAALIETLDLVLAVDTSVIHLAGALGKPVWLLNRFDPDWRWMLDREDSPWYPTLRQFRQPQVGDWESVLKRVRAELMALSA